MGIEEAVEIIKKYSGQLKEVAARLEGLSPELATGDKLCEEIFYGELVFAQKLIVELTKLTIGDDENKPEENADSAFMPGELNDVISEEEDGSSSVKESH